ncbi:unnamed protein product [Paramecium octaurelia]|uniref:Uncharacterized protein n=1 Tax=Paramecium octaurelia TaxID=43137 RepID=A0A8S1TQ81_PAROT|nr:unnamed protein product [Paramecium octaurelia]
MLKSDRFLTENIPQKRQSIYKCCALPHITKTQTLINPICVRSYR